MSQIKEISGGCFSPRSMERIGEKVGGHSRLIVQE